MKEKNYWQKLLISTISKKEASLTLRLRQGIYRTTISRMLAEAKKEGIVKIEIEDF